MVTVGMFDITRSPLMPEHHVRALRDRLGRLTDIHRTVAARHGGYFVDLSAHPAARAADVYSADLLHLSARGHAIAAAELVRTLAG